ncbi:MAG TPA: LptE family protein [Thermoanaerobaculia bacterium]|nr:LptE family protein [Thermoanaerobaculia bacterium]
MTRALSRAPHLELAARCLLLVLAALPLGCGYALVGRGSNIPDSIHSVYLSPLENATRRSEVEQILTRALAEELVTRKRFTLVNEASQANAVLAGKVVGFDTTPLTFDDQGRATEYQITITASMAFRDRAADKVLWQNDRYIYKESYQVDPSEQRYFDREKIAIEEAAGRFARTVVIDLLEGF